MLNKIIEFIVKIFIKIAETIEKHKNIFVALVIIIGIMPVLIIIIEIIF